MPYHDNRGVVQFCNNRVCSKSRNSIKGRGNGKKPPVAKSHISMAAGSRLISIFLILLAFTVAARAASTGKASSLVNDLRSALVVLHGDVNQTDGIDLSPVTAAIGHARIVGVGEGVHGADEITLMQVRLIQELVHHGFTLLALEANGPEVGALDAYIKTGVGDPVKLAIAL